MSNEKELASNQTETSGCGYSDHGHEHHYECNCGHHHDHANEHHHECSCDHHHNHGHEHHHHDYEPHHGLTINFDGEVQADINRVWEILTENEYITQWSQGLRIEDYRPGGKLIYTDELETEHSFMILDIEAPVLFTFTWQEGTIAFELKGTSETTTLINFSNWLEIVDENAAISLTNWMISLQKIAALAEGVAIEDRDTQYVEILPRMRQMLSLEDTNTIEFE